MHPKITIVTPSFNQGEYLEETILSVLNQNYPNLEFIIIDGGSTDNSIDIIKGYQTKLNYWVSEPDLGQSDAINKGFNKSTGDIFCWLNSDDIFQENTLNTIGKYFSDNPDCSFVTGDGDFISEDKEKIFFKKNGKSYDFMNLLKYHKGNFLPQPSVFFKKEVIDQVGLLNLDLKYTMDLDLWLRIIKKNKLFYINKTLSSLRQHKDAKTTRDNEQAMNEVEFVVSKHARNIKTFKYLILKYELKKFVANSSLTNAIIHYNKKETYKSLEALKRSLYKYPLIIFDLNFLKLLIKLILPFKIKNIFFK